MSVIPNTLLVHRRVKKSIRPEFRREKRMTKSQPTGGVEATDLGPRSTDLTRTKVKEHLLIFPENAVMTYEFHSKLPCSDIIKSLFPQILDFDETIEFGMITTKISKVDTL